MGRPHDQIKIFRREPVAAPENHRLLQDGFQLADVAAPRVLLQPSERPPRDPAHRHAVALVELGEEVGDEQRKIFPERPVLDRHGKVPMGGSDEPHVHAPCLGGSHGPDLAALQEAEEPVIQISEVVVG